MESGGREGNHEAAGPQAAQASGGGPAPTVDIGVLTAKVYRLMLDDLRLEQARGAMTGKS